MLKLTVHSLGDGLSVSTGALRTDLLWNDAEFLEAWELHPRDRHRVTMVGKWVETPRWQQAYGANYNYTGSRNNARPIPTLLGPLLSWVRREIDDRLNGMLLNWYEGSRDYIGPHRDSTKNMIEGAPIVTVSFGESRTFRLEHGKGQHRRLFKLDASNGTVIVLPYATNRVWKHSVPARTSHIGRRISVTFRAFESGVLPATEYWERPIHGSA